MANKTFSDDLYMLIKEQGKHLADSRSTLGAKRGTYLDDISNKPCGAGEFVKVNPKDFSNDSGVPVEAVAALVSLAIAAGYGIAKAAPHVKKWISESAVPWIRVKFESIKGNARVAGRHSYKALSGKEETTSLKEQVFYAEPKDTITAAQAQKELIDAFILVLSGYKKANRVANAEVILPSGEIIAGTELLLNQQIIDQINDALIRNPKLLSEQQVLDLSELLGYTVVSEGVFLPLSTTIIADAIKNG